MRAFVTHEVPRLEWVALPLFDHERRLAGVPGPCLIGQMMPNGLVYGKGSVHLISTSTYVC